MSACVTPLRDSYDILLFILSARWLITPLCQRHYATYGRYALLPPFIDAVITRHYKMPNRARAIKSAQMRRRYIAMLSAGDWVGCCHMIYTPLCLHGVFWFSYTLSPCRCHVYDGCRHYDAEGTKKKTVLLLRLIAIHYACASATPWLIHIAATYAPSLTCLLSRYRPNFLQSTSPLSMCHRII